MARTNKFKNGSKSYSVRIPANEPERSQVINVIHEALKPFEIKKDKK